MPELPNCQVCGCTSYNKASGFYVCANCDTQSQEIQEQLFEQSENQRANDEEERDEIISVYVKEDKPLTSWECFNLILRGLVDELCELGASPDLKVVAFQLWACYLQKANVAFFSKQNEKLPSLPLGFRAKDVEILYGVPNLRRILFKDYFRKKKKDIVKNNEETFQSELINDGSSSSSSNVSLLSLRSLRHKQRKLAMSELNESSTAIAESIASQNESLQTLGSNSNTTVRGRSKGRKRLKISFKTSTQAALNDILQQMKSLKNIKDEDTLIRVRRKINRKMFDSKRSVKVEGNMTVSMTTLISVLRIALKLIGDEILLGDILRWICEGRLSVSRAEKFLPSSEYASKVYEMQFCGRTGFQIDVKNFTKLIDLKDVPTPDLYKLVRRYCVDLCLPMDFIGYVHGIMNFLPPVMNYASHNFRIFPEYELRALAYIIVAFKMLFSLDGLTERYQSEFAESVNSWKQWIKYVECRKAILAKCDPVVNNRVYRGRIDNEKVYEKYWNKSKSLSGIKFDRINPVFISTSGSALDKLQQKETNYNYPDVEFPASLTPHLSNLRYLLQNHPYLIPDKAKDLLETEFSNHSIKYITDETWCQEIADKCVFEIEFVPGLAPVNILSYEKVEDTVPVVSKTGTIPAYIPTYVDLIDEPAEKGKKSKHKSKSLKCRKFEFDWKVIESLNVEKQKIQEQRESAQLQRPRFNIYQPMKDYWFFHEYHRGISNEEFNELTRKEFSASFRWFFKECASMIKTELSDLYLEVVSLESVLYGLTSEGNDYAHLCPVKLFANEW